MTRIVLGFIVFIALCIAPASAAQSPSKPAEKKSAQSQPASKPVAPVPTAPTAATAPAGSAEPVAKDPVDPGWLEKMKEEDRAPVEELRGYAPPALGSNLAWLPEKPGGAPQPLTWNDLRGRVVVLQSFTTASIAPRKWPERVAMALKDFKPKDLRIIALHTPEAAEKAAEFLSRQQPPAGIAVAIDAKGNTCDALGMYKTPVNIVVDRRGVVRFVGLNERGLVRAVAQLTQEKFDATKPPPTRAAAPVASSTEKAEFPPAVGKVSYAEDLRGKAAPDFFAEEWITKQPAMRGRVTVIDFWATWCGPCRAAIPHMNELADQFGDRATFIGLSDEKQLKFEEGQRKYDLKTANFHYALALDPSQTMYKVFAITGIPHCAVMSSDWIVRWQGMPAQLSEKVLDQIIRADAAASGKSIPATSSGVAHSRKRWVNG